MKPPNEVRINGRVSQAGMERSVAQRVQRGAAWLDTKRPGWADQISVGRLDVGSGQDCLIAQLGGGSYYRGLNALDPDYDLNAHAHGFVGYGPVETLALNHEWRTLILRRQYGDNPPGPIGRFLTKVWKVIFPG